MKKLWLIYKEIQKRVILLVFLYLQQRVIMSINANLQYSSDNINKRKY